MAKKSTIEWADILGPARKFEAAVTKTRSLYDLPLVADGAKEVALLSIFKEEQRFAFEPVMRALQRLSKITDWSPTFFVCDRVESEFFDWRKMPLRQYSSFEDFYRRELEATWGKWESLQHTWKEVVKGKITEEEGRRIILNNHGGDRRSKEAMANQVGPNKNDSNLKPSEANTKVHWMARLDKERPELAARVRAKTMSATAAATEAGFRKKRASRKLTALERVLKLLPKLTEAETRQLQEQWMKKDGFTRAREAEFEDGPVELNTKIICPKCGQSVYARPYGRLWRGVICKKCNVELVTERKDLMASA